MLQYGLAVVVLGVLSVPVFAAGGKVSEAFDNATVDVSFRYRFEGVNQDGFAENARANTLLSRITAKTGEVGGVQAVVEFDHVSDLFADDFNDTVNGNTQFPVVADPDGSDLNQAYLQYRASPNTQIRLGRQRIVHGNQRFIGGVPWRQNEQTFDGVRVLSNFAKGWALDYAYVTNVNRIFGNDSPNANLDSQLHLARLNFTPAKGHNFSGFAYRLDFDNAAALSNATYGIDYNFKGSISDNLGARFQASYAQQTDISNSPFDYSASFYTVNGDLNFSGVTVGAGIEVLGSDNNRGFITPLATLHLFQGFADIFLNTPNVGVEDTYLKVATKVRGVQLTATYHQFDAEAGSSDFGNELNLLVTYKFNKTYGLLMKYADYSAEQLATDTQKAWVQLTAKF